MASWEYGGTYKKYDMSGIIELPYQSKVQVCDWTVTMPEFMKSADTLFIDPPWNTGNLKTFYTKASKEYPEFDFVEFTKTLFKRIDQIAPEFLFIEIGKQYLSEYLSECKDRYQCVTFYNSTYYNNPKNKCYVIHATDDRSRKRYKELEDMDEAKIIAWICRHHVYRCIGDLCMGKGLVGKHAFMNGKQFVGTELNPKRLAKLVDLIKGKSI